MADDSSDELKHEAIMDSRDYIDIYNQYDRGSYKDVRNPLTHLLVAKACFFKQQYEECFKVLQRIDKDISTKVLYERQALLLKCCYLRDPHNIDTLDRIVRDYELAKNKCPGRPLTVFHHAQIQALRNVVAEGARLAPHSRQLIRPELKAKIQALQRMRKFEGMPCYLISTKWSEKLNEYLLAEGEYPGPITNFELLNHVHEFAPHTKPQHAYMNTVTFPCAENRHYVVVGRKHWQLLYETFSGLSIKRVYGLNPKNSREVHGYDSLSRILLEYDQTSMMMQWDMCTYWDKSVLPVLSQKFGPGQLKELSSNKTYMIVKPGKVHQPSSPMKYVSIDVTDITASNGKQSMRKINLINSYDFEQYRPEKCTRKCTLGLTNLGNTCYMNSALQSLCNLQAFSSYFFVNRYLKRINLSDSNRDGSHGDVTCAFADLVKKLWFGNDEARYIDPTLFKKAFGERFSVFEGYDQQDAQEFLLFMLNCMHEDLNQNNQMSVGQRESVTGKAFENARSIALNHYNRHNKSIISQLFNSFHYHEIRCDECEFTNYRFDNYMMVGLQVPPDVPMVSLFFVSVGNMTEATKIEVLINDITKVRELTDIVKKHLQIKSQHEVHAIMFSNDFKDTLDISPDEQIKYVYKQCGKNKLFFLYEVASPAEGQQVCMITYTYKAGSAVVYDGFPRVLCLDQSLSEVGSEAQLRRIVHGLMPNVKQSDEANDVIESFKHKKMKGKFYQAEHRVLHKKAMKLFEYSTYKEKLGTGEKQRVFNLENLLENYSIQESIDESERWFCQNCKQIRKAHKTDRIYAVGKYLMIHLKRFTDSGKILTKIDYPVWDLDMTRFIHEDVKSRASNKYDLQAVILHIGSLNSGHYTCFSRNSDKTEWLEYDDDIVRPKDEATVVDNNAYILVYERRDSENVYNSRLPFMARD